MLAQPCGEGVHERRTYHDGGGSAKKRHGHPSDWPAHFWNPSGFQNDLRHSRDSRLHLVRDPGHTSDMMGAYWDVSWHLSVGRDTFWTPAHMAIQLSGVLGGLTSGFLILSTTFGRSPTALKERHQAYEFGLFGDHSELSLLPGVLSP